MTRFIQLVYASQARPGFQASQLTELVARSQERNRAVGITGALYSGDGVFAQVLEGPPAPVFALYARVLEDPRHVDIQTLTVRQVEERTFPQWGMAQVRGQVAPPVSPAALLEQSASGSTWVDGPVDEILTWFRHTLHRQAG